MGMIRIEELEVYYHVGVPEEERAEAQRLVVSVAMEVDTAKAEQTDDVLDTVDYFAVSQRLLGFGEGRSWKLIERLSAEIADMILADYAPLSVEVEVKKYVIPEARYVSALCRKPSASRP